MASEREQRRQKSRNRVNLDIDPDIDREMTEWAAELGISRSKLYELFALDGLDGLDDPERLEEIARQRRPQKSLKFPFTLDFQGRKEKYKKKKR